MGELVQEDRLLTVHEVSARCNASPTWVRKAIQLGLLPYVDLALEPNPRRREPRIQESVVDIFLKSRERREELTQDAQARVDRRRGKKAPPLNRVYIFGNFRT